VPDEVEETSCNAAWWLIAIQGAAAYESRNLFFQHIVISDSINLRVHCTIDGGLASWS